MSRILVKDDTATVHLFYSSRISPMALSWYPMAQNLCWDTGVKTLL